MSRNERMLGVFDFDAFAKLDKHVVGVGAVGGWLVKYLASMGIPNVTMWDFDTVAEHNIGNQGFTPDQVGKAKVDVRLEDAKLCFPDCDWRAAGSAWQKTAGDVYFVCVDSLQARSEIYNACAEEALIIDMRMLALNYMAYALKGKDERYDETLTSTGLQSGDCASRSTLHAANMAATLGLTLAMQHASGQETPFQVKGDLFSLEQQPVW